MPDKTERELKRKFGAYFRKTPVSSVFCIMMVASMYKGKHASNRVISVIFSVILNRRTSSTPQSSALKSAEISAVEV